MARGLLLDVSNRGGVGEVRVVPRMHDRIYVSGTCWGRDGRIPLARELWMWRVGEGRTIGGSGVWSDLTLRSPRG